MWQALKNATAVMLLMVSYSCAGGSMTMGQQMSQLHLPHSLLATTKKPPSILAWRHSHAHRKWRLSSINAYRNLLGTALFRIAGGASHPEPTAYKHPHPAKTKHGLPHASAACAPAVACKGRTISPHNAAEHTHAQHRNHASTLAT
jgi:hypothetical protein